MNDNISNAAERNLAWSRIGEVCVMLCVAISAVAPLPAQQDEPSASLPHAQVALTNPSFTQPIGPSPAKVSPPSRSTQSAVPASRATAQAFSYFPMTRQERWQDYRDQNFDSSGAFFEAFFTALGDDQGGVPRWDSGMTGLSEHLGSEFGRFTIAGTIHSSLAATLHQDTRYFPCSCRGGFRRALHAADRTLFTYGDNGHIYPDVSGLAGIYGGAMLMTMWYPAEYTATGYGVRQANIAVGVTSAIYVIREFSPEIRRAFHRRKAGQSPDSIGGAPVASRR